MLQKTFLFMTPLLLAGCMMAPVQQDPRWTDDALAAQPAQEAPVYVQTLRLSESERQILSEHEADVVETGRDVLDQGDALRGPDPQSEQYAAEQRQRTELPQ